jgi:hypothetical protein
MTIRITRRGALPPGNPLRPRARRHSRADHPAQTARTPRRERMNSPLENREVRLRGLHGWVPAVAAALPVRMVDSTPGTRPADVRAGGQRDVVAAISIAPAGAALPELGAARPGFGAARPGSALRRAFAPDRSPRLERMNSPLEDREVRLRGLHGRVPAVAAALPVRMVDSTRGTRPAGVRAGGQCEVVAAISIAPAGRRQSRLALRRSRSRQSAQADFVWSLRRIHSLGWNWATPAGALHLPIPSASTVDAEARP